MNVISGISVLHKRMSSVVSTSQDDLTNAWNLPIHKECLWACFFSIKIGSTAVPQRIEKNPAKTPDVNLWFSIHRARHGHRKNESLRENKSLLTFFVPLAGGHGRGTVRPWYHAAKRTLLLHYVFVIRSVLMKSFVALFSRLSFHIEWIITWITLPL